MKSKSYYDRTSIVIVQALILGDDPRPSFIINWTENPSVRDSFIHFTTSYTLCILQLCNDIFRHFFLLIETKQAPID